MKESLVNLLLFIPLGMNLRLLWPQLRWAQAAAAGLGLSLSLEVTQYLLAIGSSDTSDLITNSAGCLLGFASAGRLNSLPTICKWLGILMTVLALAFVLSPIRFSAA